VRDPVPFLMALGQTWAAAGLYALDTNLERLAEDHAKAKGIAERVAQSEHVLLDPATVRTNIIVFRLADDGPDAPTVVGRARELGVLVFAFGPRTVRAVTHLDVDDADVERACSLVPDALGATHVRA